MILGTIKFFRGLNHTRYEVTYSTHPVDVINIRTLVSFSNFKYQITFQKSKREFFVKNS